MYVNKYLLNEKSYIECILTLSYRWRIIIGLLYFLICLIFFFDYYDYLFLGCGIFILLLTIILPIISIRRTILTAKGLNGGNFAETIVIFNENNITLDETVNHMEFSYSNISKVKESKHFIGLKLKNKGFIIIKKDGFVTGDLTTFRLFIESKINK